MSRQYFAHNFPYSHRFPCVCFWTHGNSISWEFFCSSRCGHESQFHFIATARAANWFLSFSLSLTLCRCHLSELIWRKQFIWCACIVVRIRSPSKHLACKGDAIATMMHTGRRRELNCALNFVLHIRCCSYYTYSLYCVWDRKREERRCSTLDRTENFSIGNLSILHHLVLYFSLVAISGLRSVRSPIYLLFFSSLSKPDAQLDHGKNTISAEDINGTAWKGRNSSRAWVSVFAKSYKDLI